MTDWRKYDAEAEITKKYGRNQEDSQPEAQDSAESHELQK